MENVKAKYARTILTVAGPLDVNGIKYTDTTDRVVEQ